MSLLTFCQWLQDIPVATALRESTLMFPIVEGSHLLGLGLSVGTSVLADLRLLGITMKKEPASDVMNQLLPWTLAGFALMFVTGSFLFASEAVKCYDSLWFRLKILFLFLAGVNALIFHLTAYRKMSDWDLAAIPPRGVRLAGLLGLLLWALVIAAGRTTAYKM
jgi:hypothetical protein